MADGRWRMADGGFRIADGGCWIADFGLIRTRTVRTGVRGYEWYEWYELTGVLFEPFAYCTFGNAHLLSNCNIGHALCFKVKSLFEAGCFFVFINVPDMVLLNAVFDKTKVKKVDFLDDLIDDNIFAVVNIFTRAGLELLYVPDIWIFSAPANGESGVGKIGLHL